MIDIFESTARVRPDQVFFTFVDFSGSEVAYTYRQTRFAAASFARKLRAQGVRKGSLVAVDLPNCPEWVFLALAAAYGSFTLVALNQRLNEAEKTARLLDLEHEGERVVVRVDAAYAKRIMDAVYVELEEGESEFGGARRERVIMGVQQDVIEDTIHFAERAAHLFDSSVRALIMFTSGTTGRSKAVPLTWDQLVGSARASNRALSRRGEGLWQVVLPLYHVGGLQVLVRSVENGTPLRLYERFDAERVLRDAESRCVTHISVVDKMLQDMLTVEEERLRADTGQHAGGRGALRAGLPQVRGDAARLADERETLRAGSLREASSLSASRLGIYRCVLLGGGALNPQTIKRALDLGVRVYASYGMTETASQIANELVTPQFSGGLSLMDGYAARIVDPDEEGFGRLAVRGPGVFDGYLNAHAPFTVDGFFLTGDTAALHQGRIYVKERTADMFVSGGENVYPAEIVRALLRIPGVSDAHVFGAPDATWGRRPVAVVERSHAQLRAADVKRAARSMLSKLNMPRTVLVVDQLPRKGIGKIDRAATEELFERRLEVDHVILHHVRIPFRKPFKTAQTTLENRDVVVVEVVDHAGRVGLGECVSFATDWYLPETLGDDLRYLEEVLAPAVREQAFAHPREAFGALSSLRGAEAHPAAVSAVENALWDLYGRISGVPLWKLLGDEYERLRQQSATPAGGFANDAGIAGGADPARETLPRAAYMRGSRALVAAGAVVGMGAPSEVVEEVRGALNAGYRRVKIKIAPGQGLAAVRAVREAFPSLLITLDANQSFGERDLDELRAYDDLGIGWIEEPIDVGASKVRRRSFGGNGGALAKLARLQRGMSTPLCVDESYVDGADAWQILRYTDLRCIAVKIAKFGGIEPALQFIVQAQAQGCEVWMGGMYDMGISKRVHAAFETLPGVIVPGDVGSTSRYFDIDITDPPYEASRGYVLLNGEGHESGVGCNLNLESLSRVLVRRVMC